MSFQKRDNTAGPFKKQFYEIGKMIEMNSLEK